MHIANIVGIATDYATSSARHVDTGACRSLSSQLRQAANVAMSAFTVHAVNPGGQGNSPWNYDRSGKSSPHTSACANRPRPTYHENAHNLYQAGRALPPVGSAQYATTKDFSYTDGEIAREQKNLSISRRRQ